MFESAWYYAKGKQKIGPVPFAELQKLAASGQIRPLDMLLQCGSQKWMRADSVNDLFPNEASSTGTAIPAPVATFAEPLPSPIDENSTSSTANNPNAPLHRPPALECRRSENAFHNYRHFGIACATALILLVGFFIGRISVTHDSGNGIEKNDDQTVQANGEAKEIPTVPAGIDMPKSNSGTDDKEPSYGGKSLSAWLVLSKDGNETTREEAVGALTRIGKPAVVALCEQLKDKDESIRNEATLALTKIGSAANSAIQALIEASKHSTSSTRKGASVALAPITEQTGDSGVPAPRSPEEILRAYLDSPKWQDRLRFVLNPSENEALMATRYTYVTLPAKYESITALPQHREDVREFKVVLGKKENAFGVKVDVLARYVLFSTSEGWKVDWKCSMGYNSMSLTAFKSERPTMPVSFRVGTKLSDHYTGDFWNTQDTYWSVEIVAVNGTTEIVERITGYVAKSSNHGKRIYELLKNGGGHKPMIVTLRYPEGARGTECLIDTFLRDNWLDNEGKELPKKDGQDNHPDVEAKDGKQKGNKPGTSPKHPIVLFSWEETRKVIGPTGTIEEGKRDDQRYILYSGQLLVIEGANACDVFFPATPEGLRAGQAFLSSKLFTPDEQKTLQGLVEKKSDATRLVGRFRVSLSTTGNSERDLLPKFWIRLDIEPANAENKTVQHARKSLGDYFDDDELLSVSKFGKVNRLAKNVMDTAVTKKELFLRLRTLNNLAEFAGLTADETLAHFERSVDLNKKNGVELIFGVSAASDSLAFRIALNKEAFENWRKGKKNASADLAPPSEDLAPKELDPTVVEVWKKAGAQVGWYGQRKFYETKPNGLATLPAFRWPSFEPVLIIKLPAPSEAFALDLSRTRVTDTGLKELAGLKNLQILNLTLTDVTDAGLKELAGLKNLQIVYLGFTKVTDAGMKELAGLKNLRTLDLTGNNSIFTGGTDTGVTDAGLKELAGLKNLQNVYLHFTNVTDAGLKELTGLKSLRTLDLSRTRVTDAGLKELAGFTNLQTLNLSSTAVTDVGMQELARLTSLQTLDLSDTKVTGAGLKELAALKSLSSLYLRGAQVTGAGLKEIAGLKSLKALDLSNTKVTYAEVTQLRKVRPNLFIIGP
jgi:internalin A